MVLCSRSSITTATRCWRCYRTERRNDRERLLRRRTQTVCVELADTRDEQTIAIEIRVASERVETIFRGPGSAARDALRAAILAYRLETTQ